MFQFSSDLASMLVCENFRLDINNIDVTLTLKKKEGRVKILFSLGVLFLVVIWFI